MDAKTFYNVMIHIREKYSNGEELRHVEMDYLIYCLLRSLGYEKGAEVFKDTEKWYA